MASYPSHHLALYTINGKLLRCEMHSDSINVSVNLTVRRAGTVLLYSTVYIIQHCPVLMYTPVYYSHCDLECIAVKQNGFLMYGQYGCPYSRKFYHSGTTAWREGAPNSAARWSRSCLYLFIAAYCTQLYLQANQKITSRTVGS